MQLTPEQEFSITKFSAIAMSLMSLKSRKELIDMFKAQVYQNAAQQRSVGELTVMLALQQLQFSGEEGEYPDW